MPLGNSADSTALVLAGFMLGMAAGAWLGSWVARRVHSVLVVYSAAELALALFAGCAPWLFAQLAQWVVPTWLQSIPAAGFGVRAAIALLLITLPCLVMGATLPLLLATPGCSQARAQIGLLYGLNTCGATAAAAIAGFHGIAQWGIAGCSRRAAACSVAAAALATLAQRLLRTSTEGHRAASGKRDATTGAQWPESRVMQTGTTPGAVTVAAGCPEGAGAAHALEPAQPASERVPMLHAGRVSQRPEKTTATHRSTISDIQSAIVRPRGVSTSSANASLSAESAVATSSVRVDANRRSRIAMLIAFVSGFALLGAEVIWTRLLTFVFGHDTYAFATLLCVVLLGHTLGGLLYAALARRSPRAVAGGSLALTAAALLGCYYVASACVIHGGRDPFGLGDRFLGAGLLSLEILREWAFTPLLALIPCLLSGVTYPASVALCAEACASSRPCIPPNPQLASLAMGRIGLTNGIGAALGATLTAFGLVPLLGLSAVLGTFALLLGLVVAALTLQGSSRRAVRVGGGLVPIVIAVCIIVAPRDLPKRMLHSVVGKHHQQFAYYQEARTATVSVIHNTINGERQLLVNAVNEVTTRLVHDQSFKLLGQLGPLLHPNPKRAVMICLGAGLAAGSALTHPLERLDVVDLLGAVQNGARYFAEENNHVLDDPRLHLHVNDGRQYLLTTPDRYDVAIVDSTHPKSVDSWILYTREFFQLLHDRLDDGGIVVQWLPLHGLSEREFRSVVATFAAVFPQMTLWASVGFETYGQVGYAKLVGQRGGHAPRIDCLRLQERLRYPRVQHDLARYGMQELPDILDQFVAGPDRIRRWTEGVPIHHDDRPFLSYVTLLSEGRAMTPDRLLAVRESPRAYLERAPAPGSELDLRLGRALTATGLVMNGQLQAASVVDPSSEKLQRYLAQSETSLPYYLALATRYRGDSEREFEAATQLMALGHADQAATVYEQALRTKPRSLRLRVNQALSWLEANESRRAANDFAQLLAERPDAPILKRNLAAALLAQGEPGVARAQLSAALSRHPHHFGLKLLLVDAQMALGQWSAALALLRELLLDAPFDAELVARQARIHQRLGDAAAAHAAWQAALQLDPYNAEFLLQWARGLSVAECPAALAKLDQEPYRYWPSTSVKLARGLALGCSGNGDAAVRAFVDVLEREPDNAEAALELGRVLVALRRTGEATDALCIASRLGAGRADAIMELRRIGKSVKNCAE